MAGFRKAKAEQAAIKMGLYGPAGSGKTLTALLLAEGLAKLSGKRIAYIDTEHGTDFYCQSVKARAVHPDSFDFDAIYTRSITEVLQACRGLKESDYSVLVLDSVTHLWEAAMAAYGGKLTKAGTIPFHAWGKIKKPYKDLMSWMLGSPIHVIICGRQKNLYEEDEETEELKQVGVTMRAEGETPYEPHILIRMEALKPSKTQERAQVVAFAEKDRTGVLAGRSFVNPTFDMLCKPLLGLLGATQASVPGSDETASIDAEQLAKEETQRAEQSSEALRTWSAKIELAEDVPALKSIGSQITPQLKATMLPSDVATLRERYLAREQRLASMPAPASDADESGPSLEHVEKLIRDGKLDEARDLARSFDPAVRLGLIAQINAKEGQTA